MNPILYTLIFSKDNKQKPFLCRLCSMQTHRDQVVCPYCHRCHCHTFRFLLNNFWRDALISFRLCRTLYHCKIQVKFDIGNHPSNFGWVMVLFWVFVVCFRSLTFEGMHWFQSNFAELYITVKYRSSSILVIIRQIFGRVMGLWPFFRLSFCWCVDNGFRSITFDRDALILLKVCRRIYHCKMQVKFNNGNHPKNFGRVMALFQLSFCWCVDIGFHSITFAGMHWFYWKFTEGYIIM